jgi:two-component system NtrC family sensor kinase
MRGQGSSAFTNHSNGNGAPPGSSSEYEVLETKFGAGVNAMGATLDQELAELRRAYAEVRKERDAALEELQARTAALAIRNSEYGERIEQQSAAIDVLKAMSGSPGDARPVFDLIVRRAQELYNLWGVSLCEFDGALVHLRAYHGLWAEDILRDYVAVHPLVPTRGSVTCRAILDKETIHIRDIDSDPNVLPIMRRLGWKSNLALPLMRDGASIGAISLTSPQRGGFTDSQVALLQTFAEQAVIAISSAETYRALQTRTADLQQSLEYQTATSDVLKVISRSTVYLQPVLDTVAETAARLCDAEQVVIYQREDESVWLVANCGFSSEYESFVKGLGAFPIDLYPQNVGPRAIRDGRAVHIHDVTLIPGYGEGAITLGKQRTSLGVPLMRESDAIGVIVLARQRVEPFTDRQIQLVSTFADQAVIAIENARLLTEQREALEQQTATAEVLQVINASPGNLVPVFDTILERARTLCGFAHGTLNTFDGTHFYTVATYDIPEAFAEVLRRPRISGPQAPLLRGDQIIHIRDFQAIEASSDDPVSRAAIEAGIRTVLFVALRSERGLLGYLTADRMEVRPFSENEIGVMENFAAQAVIAMENARLLTETREALDQQTATSEVLQVINASPGDLAPVFDVILEKAHRLCDITQGSLELYDGQNFRAVATHGLPDSFADQLRQGYPASDNPATRPLIEGRPYSQILDVTQHEFPFVRARGSARTLLCVALRRDDKLLGMIACAPGEVRPFTEKQIALLENFAAQAVIAMDNARLLNEVRQRQEELRITFENMGDGVAMFDETQHLVAWNGKFQELYDLPDTLLEQHRTYEEYLRFLAKRGDFGAGIDTAEQIRELVASTGQPYGYERTRPDGRVIEIRRNPVPDGGFVLIFSDITERKRSEVEIRAARDAAEAAYRDLKAAQASLIQAEKMASLGQLTAGIAHEIKNPLNFVNNFAELSGDMLDELNEAVVNNRQAEVNELTETLKGNLAKIAEHGRRADNIVRGMLEHSRGSSGEQRQVELNALVEEALNLAYHGARAQDQTFNVTLQRELGAGIAPITLAPQDLTRVLLNLISNGFYAARERQRTEAIPGFEPTVTVSTRDLDDAVEIRVRDNGIGIPAEIKDRLFQPFFTTKPPGEGTGLGLSMSYDIITQQHGGSISVDSKVGEYSEFTVQLPRSS